MPVRGDYGKHSVNLKATPVSSSGGNNRRLIYKQGTKRDLQESQEVDFEFVVDEN